MSHVWLRHEYKPDERRAPITPEQVGQLIALGHQVSVEKSPHRVFADAAYQAHGAELVAAGSWYQAPGAAFILGIKEVLQEEIHADNLALKHRHIYFAHVFKGQRATPETMRRFRLGSGTLLDLEYLVDETGKRVAAFSYAAGFAGAIAAVHVWVEKTAGKVPPFTLPTRFLSRAEFIGDLRSKLREIGRVPSALVIGAGGRSGSGAVDALSSLDIKPGRWGRADTAGGGPFAEILKYELLCNCVFLKAPVAPFLTAELLSAHPEGRLSVVADVSNDLSYNPIFGISTSTKFSNAATRVGGIDVIEIENLPVLTPLDSSVEYASQFFPHLLALLNSSSQKHSVWEKAALKYFEHHDIPQIAAECGRELADIYLESPQDFDVRCIQKHVSEIFAKNPLSQTDRLFFADHLSAGAAERLSEAEEAAFNDLCAKAKLEKIYDSPRMRRHHALLSAINRFTRGEAFECMKPVEVRDDFFEMCDRLAELIDGEEGAAERYAQAKSILEQRLGSKFGNQDVQKHLDEIERSAIGEYWQVHPVLHQAALTTK